ncbi:MAG: hypothetical protein AB7G24_03005 [Novosphingobium sp.]
MTGLCLTNDRINIHARLCLALLAACGGVSSAIAEEPGDNLPSGSFIVSRPITNSPAEGPHFPEQPDYVVMGGQKEVLAALGGGLQPISDAEQATVFAGAVPQGGLVAGALDQGLDVLSAPRGVTNAALAQEQSGGVSGIVRGAIGVLPSALGAVRDALGAVK